MKKAIFLDRDGVINRVIFNKKYGKYNAPSSLKEFRLLPGVAEIIKKFKENGFLVVIVSNQPDVARKKFSIEELNRITKIMKERLIKKGAVLDGVYYCLHHPDPEQVVLKKYLKNCNCRKPKPGLLFKAIKKFKISPRISWMVGDGLNDIKAGQTAGCKTILIFSKKVDYNSPIQRVNVKPDYIVRSLKEASKIILKQN